ncbi:MAG: SNF2-related protein [Oceanococcus sp.]
MQYNSSDIQKAFDPATFRRGKSYFEQGRVLDLESADLGRILSGNVRGDSAKPYSTQIQLRDDARRFSSRCNCPVGNQCKHAVALLLAALESPPLNDSTADISAWVDDLFAQHSQTQKKPEPHALSFHCSLPDHPEPHVAVKVQRKGRSGKALSLTTRWQRGESLDSEFRSLLNRLRGFADESPYLARLHDAESGPLLQSLVESGHCHWENGRRVLQWAEARQAQARWTLHENGSQSLRLDVGRRAKVLPLEPPLYFDAHDACIGPISTDLSPDLLPLLNRAPQIAPHQVEEFIQLLDERGLSGVPRPVVPKAKDLAKNPPQARLALMHIDDLSDSRKGFVPDIYVGVLQAMYQEFAFDPGQGDSVVLRKQGEKLIRIHRDLAAEQALLDELVEFHDVSIDRNDSENLRILTPYDGSTAWARFIESRMTQLSAQGWQIEQRDSFDIRLFEPDQWLLETHSQDNDWFELSAGFEVDGEQHNLLELLSKLLQDGEDMQSLLPAGDAALIVDLGRGRMLRLPRKRIETVLSTLTELYRNKPLNRAGRLKLHKLDLPRLQDWHNQWQWQPPEALVAFARSLGKPISPVELSPLFQGELRAYQHDGLSWMQHLYRHGFGGLLADDMGLGKTVQTLAHLAAIKQSQTKHHSLIVAPTSVLGNWRAEAQRFVPSLSLCIWHGNQRHSGAGLHDADLVITSYGTLLRDETAFSDQNWSLIVLDEAQAIKNPHAKISACVKRLNSQQKLCLSGTPMENHLGELWSQFDFLAPGFLGDARSFRQLYRSPIEKEHNSARAEQLQRRIQPFLLRRTKPEVATDLPPKTEIIQTISLGEEQASLYETVRIAMEHRIRAALNDKGLQRSQIVILDALLKLRQICCDPRLVKLESAREVSQSAKMETLVLMLADMIEQGRRILLFSQFTEMLSLIEAELKKRQWRYLLLTGQTRQRQALVDEFQNGDVPVFLISLKAGGTGLNLTAADTVIHYDPWWNPAVENQASDRAHRIGQDKPVFIYKLICENSVEQRIQAMQERKRQLSEKIYAHAPSELQQSDLDWLLQPLQTE